jgi:hypothetical protein
MPFLPYQDAMMGRPWTVNGQINPVSSMTTTGIPLAGPYRSGMMDYRESESHKNLLTQQDAAFNSPTGLNSHREMYFGEPVAAPEVFDNTLDKIRKRNDRAFDSMRMYQQKIDAGNEAFGERLREERARENERMREAVSDMRRKKEEEKALRSSAKLADSLKPSWGPTTDYGNGLWEKRNEGRDETLTGYKPYGTHTHVGPDFVSIKDEKTGKHLHWDLNPLTGKPF